MNTPNNSYGAKGLISRRGRANFKVHDDFHYTYELTS